MGRPALILAALAADAAPGKNFRHYLKITDNPDIEVLRLWDAEGQSYELKMPASAAGVTELATEITVLQALNQAKLNLPFAIPNQVGQTQDFDGQRAVLFTLLGGSSPDLSRLGPGAFSKSFAEAMASLHNCETQPIIEAGLPSYDATTVLHHKVQELDRMAATGRIPAALLSRWETALEDIGLFRFHPTLTHSAINSEAVLVENQQVVGVTGFNALCVGDPAEDFRWLASGAVASTLDDALLHYRAARPQADENLAQRAILYSELELGSWLLHCLSIGDSEQIKQAEDLLNDLKENLEAGNLKELTATSFVGLAVASSIIPQAMPTQPIETLAPSALQEEVEEQDQDAPADDLTQAEPTETTLDELF
ncbi:MAG: hypothetical protein RJB32_630 [Actinomycetota bacterium]